MHLALLITATLSLKVIQANPLDGDWPSFTDVPSTMPEDARNYTTNGTKIANVSVKCIQSTQSALTFDDAVNENTEELLQILENNNITATFFVSGSKAVQFPYFVRMLKNRGHQVGLSSWTGAPFPSDLAPERIIADLSWTLKAIKKASGLTPRFVRGPKGEAGKNALEVFGAMNLNAVKWSKQISELKSVPGVFNQTSSAVSSQDKASEIIQAEAPFSDIAQIIEKTKGIKLVQVAECLRMRPYFFRHSPDNPIQAMFRMPYVAAEALRPESAAAPPPPPPPPPAEQIAQPESFVEPEPVPVFIGDTIPPVEPETAPAPTAPVVQVGTQSPNPQPIVIEPEPLSTDGDAVGYVSGPPARTPLSFEGDPSSSSRPSLTSGPNFLSAVFASLQNQKPKPQSSSPVAAVTENNSTESSSSGQDNVKSPLESILSVLTEQAAPEEKETIHSVAQTLGLPLANQPAQDQQIPTGVNETTLLSPSSSTNTVPSPAAIPSPSSTTSTFKAPAYDETMRSSNMESEVSFQTDSSSVALSRTLPGIIVVALLPAFLLW